jgi:anti-sigma B factor antagonist
MFAIRVTSEGRIELEGRFDAAQVPAAQEVLSGVEESTVLDCATLDYISSAGLGVLFATQKRLMGAGGGLKLVHLNPHIREVFEIAGFDTIFDIE